MTTNRNRLIIISEGEPGILRWFWREKQGGAYYAQPTPETGYVWKSYKQNLGLNKRGTGVENSIVKIAT